MLDIEDSPWLMPGKAFSLRLAQCELSQKNSLFMSEINAALIVGLLRLWSASVYAFACGSTRIPTANRGFSWGLSDQALKRVLASLGLEFGIVLLSGFVLYLLTSNSVQPLFAQQDRRSRLSRRQQ